MPDMISADEPERAEPFHFADERGAFIVARALPRTSLGPRLDLQSYQLKLLTADALTVSINFTWRE